MAHYQVTQSRNGEDPVVLHDNIRRYNGALTVQQAHVDSAKAHLQGKALPGERVVEGPTGVEGEIATVFMLPDRDYVIVTAIVRK